MLTLACASLLVALDSDILVASLPALATHLNGTTTEAFWAGSAYLLPYAVVQPFLACLSDIFGRRPLLLISLGLFLAGSLPCALADNMATLLTGRVIQGIGGGGIVALAQAIYTDIVPLRQRPKYFGIVLLAWAIGTMIGPVVGGAFTDMSTSGWRWCFWINFPLGGIAFILSFLLIRLQPASSPLTLRQKLLTVDYLGAFLFIASTTSLLIAISWGGNTYAWTSFRTLVPLVAGILGLLFFAAYEAYLAPYPFIPPSLFPTLSSCLLFILALLYGLVLFMAVYYITFYFSAVKLVSATTAGANLIPALALALPSSIVTGLLMTRWGKWRWAVWAGHALEVLGYGLLIRLDEDTPVAQWAVTLCVAGLGSGVSLSSINFGVQANTQTDRESASATVMYTFCRSVGMCVGVSVGSAIFQGIASGSLRGKGLDAGIAGEAEAYVFGTLRFLGEEEELRGQVVGSFVAGLRMVFVVMTVVKAVALGLSLCVKGRGMDRELDGRYRVQDGQREKSSL
jgi:multidrug resistance protein